MLRRKQRKSNKNPWPRRIGRSALALAATLPLAGDVCGSEFTWENSPVSQSWHQMLNWAGTPTEVPDDDGDTAIVNGNSNEFPRLGADLVIGGLTIQGGGEVHTGNGTNNFMLGVSNLGPHDGRIRVDGANASLFVYEQFGFDVDTDLLDTFNGGTVWMVDGGDVRVDALMTNSGTIRGSGVLQFGGSGDSTNDGALIAEGNGGMVVNATGSATLDLDGAFGGGQLIATNNSKLQIDAPLSDVQFDGEIIIHDAAEVEINSAWVLRNSAGSQLTFDSAAVPGTLSGAHAGLNSSVVVGAGGANLNASTTFGSEADVVLQSGASLTFNAFSTVQNAGSFTLTDATFNINSGVTIGNGSGNFNWDGSGTAVTHVGAGGHLNIDVDRVDVINNRFDGQLSLVGDLTVETADGLWTLAGTMEFPTDADSQVTGHDIEVLGNVTLADSSNAEIYADTIFGPSSHVVNNGGILALRGNDIVFDGGQFEGSGYIATDGFLFVTSETTVNFDGIFDLDGQLIEGDFIRLDAPLNLNVESIDLTESLDEPVHITQDGQLNMQFNDPDKWYSISSNVILDADSSGGTSVQFAGADVLFSNSVQVNGSSTFAARAMIYGGVNLAASAELNLAGGTSDSPNQIFGTSAFTGGGELNILPGAQLNVHPDASIHVDVHNDGRFEPGITTGVVQIDGNYVQDNAATFGVGFDGAPGGDQDWLQVTGVAALDGLIEVATIGNFVPSPGDVYTVVTAGTRFGTFDALVFDTPSALTLTGEMQYTANGAFVAITDVDLSGDFDGDLALGCADVDALVAELSSGGMDAQYDLNNDGQVTSDDLDQWLAEAGELNVGGGYLEGDANLDGIVDGADFLVWNMHKFTVTAAWCAGDFNADGVTDGQDFTLWNENKFSASDTAMAAVPEPSAGLLGWLGVMAFGMVRRKS